MNNNKIILDLCGGTGSWGKPYAAAGYDVRVITLPDFDILHWREYPEIIEPIEANEVYGILAAPPCTMFSIARNDKTAKQARDLRAGMEIVKACHDIIWSCLYDRYRLSENNLKFWALENPRGYLERFLGRPAFDFHPYDFGDPYMKKTHLWGYFNLPKKTPVQPTRGTMAKHAAQFSDLKPVDVDYQNKLGVDTRTIRRSITPEGFANAFYKANK